MAFLYPSSLRSTGSASTTTSSAPSSILADYGLTEITHPDRQPLPTLLMPLHPSLRFLPNQQASLPARLHSLVIVVGVDDVDEGVVGLRGVLEGEEGCDAGL